MYLGWYEFGSTISHCYCTFLMAQQKQGLQGATWAMLVPCNHLQCWQAAALGSHRAGSSLLFTASLAGKCAINARV
jgi:hypothetical protein